MSTELKSHAKKVSLTRFWGGQRGSCVQVTQPRSDWGRSMQKLTAADNFFTSLQLTREQAAALAADLLDFAQCREQEEL